MTANHEHTPTKGDLKKAWDWYRANQDKQSGIEQNFRAYRWEFLRAWDAIEAAAEQRGAIKALRDAAGAIEKNNIVFDGDHYQPCNSCRSIHMNWLDYRADQMEGDDE